MEKIGFEVHRFLYHRLFRSLLDFGRLEQQDLPLPTGEAILEIEVDGDRLAVAKLRGAPLARLYSLETNQRFHKESNKGSLGVFAFKQHSATFGNIRFMAMSNK